MSDWRRLKYLANVVSSNVDKLTNEDEKPVRLVNYTDVYYGDQLTSDMPLMDATASAAEIAKFRLSNGDVLITKDSETADDIGVAAYIESASDDMVCGYHLSRIRTEGSIAHSRYLYWAISGTHAKDQMHMAATGVTRFGLRAQSIRDLLIRVPLDSEQRAIATYLDIETARIDTIISKKHRLIELLNERWNSWSRNLFGSLTCAVQPLKRCWRVIDCKHRTPVYVDEGYPVVSPGDTTPGRLDLCRTHRFVDEVDYRDLTAGDRRPKQGDIVYSRNASIGIASYVDTDKPFCMGQDVCLITSDNMDQLYLMYVLNSVGLDQLELQKIGSTFSRVNISQILEIRVPVPELGEQRILAQRFDEAASRKSRAIATLQRQIDLLVERRQALITAVVTGEMPVPGVSA